MKLVPKRKMITPRPEEMLDIIQNIYNTAASSVTGDSGTASQFPFAGFVFIIDGGGIEITTGEKGHLAIPFGCSIYAWELEADQVGSIQVDIWKSDLANFPPTDSDSITGGSEPALSAAQATWSDSNITASWTTHLSRFDILAFNVDSCSTITRCTLTLYVTRY
jgi:hypothetical protein